MKTFNWQNYIQNYPDLKAAGITTQRQAIKHWVMHGQKENRTDKLNKVINLTKNKVLIIYVYYERKNEQKNQTNLAFFIKHGLNKANWSNIDITTLFVINGHQCEVLIPNEPDIFILKEDNCSDWEGWYNGIKYIENKYNTFIYNIFTHICLINCSAFGPYIKPNTFLHWLDPFFNKLNETGSVACSPCINLMPETDAGGQGRKLVPIFTLLKIDKNILNLLINTKINNICESSTNKTIIQESNTVYGNKKNKIDAVLTGEYGLSRILIKNNYKICALLEGTTFKRIDFYNSNYLLDTVFIKNIWRWDNSYTAKPVLYTECITYMNDKLNFKNELNEINCDYSKLKNKDPIIINEYSDINEDSNWNTLEEYYNKFGYSEECIIFPKIQSNNRSCVIYTHYDSGNIIKDYVIQSLKILIYLNYDIIFYTASSSLNNIDEDILPFKINYFKNQGAGTDIYMWLDGLKKIDKTLYDWVMIVNDSFLLGINGIENMKQTINLIRTTSDLWGHWDSFEINYHYIGAPLEFKSAMVSLFINFFESKLPLCNNKNDYINKIETKIIKYVRLNGYKTNCIIKYINNKLSPFSPLLLKQWINNPETFAIKWKYHISYLRDDNIKSNYFKYLIRYLLTGNNIYISEGERLNLWVKSSDYKQLNMFNK